MKPAPLLSLRTIHRRTGVSLPALYRYVRVLKKAGLLRRYSVMVGKRRKYDPAMIALVLKMRDEGLTFRGRPTKEEEE